MTTAADFFFSSAPTVVRLDTIEISHDDFSQTYRLVANSGPDGITADGDAYSFCPMRVAPMSATDDLAQSLSIMLGDVGEIIATEINAIWSANGLNTRPSLTYRAFRSDDLDAAITGSTRVLEIASVTTTRDGARFEARAPELNQSRTGVLYTVDQFPMLRGFR